MTFVTGGRAAFSAILNERSKSQGQTTHGTAEVAQDESPRLSRIKLDTAFLDLHSL